MMLQDDTAGVLHIATNQNGPIVLTELVVKDTSASALNRLGLGLPKAEKFW